MEQWFQDIVDHGRTKTDHDSGQSLFKLIDEILVCVDGQQRLTTTQLLLVSLRDAVLAELRHEKKPAHSLLQCKSTGVPSSTEFICTQLVKEINAKLFRDVHSMQLWARAWAETIVKGSDGKLIEIASEASMAWGKIHHTGCLPSFDGGSVLTPCYLDRAPFMELLTAGVCKHELLALYGENVTRSSGACDEALLDKNLNDAIPTVRTQSSLQAEAKNVFDRLISEKLGSLPSPSPTNSSDRVAHLRLITDYALNSITLTYMEALNDVNMGRGFLWLQEKAILSDKALLCNSRPAARLRLLDLVRNLLLSTSMNLRLSKQEDFYHERWLKPLEMRLGIDQLDSAIARFVVSRVSGCQQAQRHISAFEHQVQARCRTFQEAAADLGPSVAASNRDHGNAMLLYAQFHSLAEAYHLRKGQPKFPVEDVSVLGDERPAKRARNTTLAISDETLQELLVELTAFIEEHELGNALNQGNQ